MPEQPVHHSVLVAEERSLRVYYAQEETVLALGE